MEYPFTTHRHIDLSISIYGKSTSNPSIPVITRPPNPEIPQKGWKSDRSMSAGHVVSGWTCVQRAAVAQASGCRDEGRFVKWILMPWEGYERWEADEPLGVCRMPLVLQLWDYLVDKWNVRLELGGVSRMQAMWGIRSAWWSWNRRNGSNERTLIRSAVPLNFGGALIITSLVTVRSINTTSVSKRHIRIRHLHSESSCVFRTPLWIHRKPLPMITFKVPYRKVGMNEVSRAFSVR